MRNKSFITCMVIFILACVGSVLAAQMASVVVKEAEVRQEPSFLASIVAKLQYGDKVEVIGGNGDWKEVHLLTGQAGWMHAQALSQENVSLKSGAAVGTGATSEEVALAGKGFNDQVESQYRTNNPNLNYAWINKMETFYISPAEIQSFKREGGLKGGN